MWWVEKKAAVAAFLGDGGYLDAVLHASASGGAALLASCACRFRGELMGGALLVGRLAALACDLAPARGIHTCEAALGSCHCMAFARSVRLHWKNPLGFVSLTTCQDNINYNIISVESQYKHAPRQKT